MATDPNETEVRAQIDGVIDELQTEFDTNAAFLSKQSITKQAYHGSFVNEATPGEAAMREAKASIVANGRSRLVAHFKDYGKLLNFSSTTIEGILRELYQEFRDRGAQQIIQERNFTFGSPALTGGGTGDGLMRRLNTDPDGFEIEIGTADSFVATCVADQSKTSIHEEQFLVKTKTRSKDGMQNLGAGLSRIITAVSANQSMLLNPSFTNGSTGATVTDWTVDTPGNTAKDTAEFYRSAGDGDTATSLKLTGTVTLQQFMKTANLRFDSGIPYYFQIAWKRNTGAGTLRIRLGGVTTTVVIAAQSGWQVLFLPISSANCWWKGFRENALDVTIEWTSTGGDHIWIDDAILTPWTRYRGQYYVIIGGATAFLRGSTGNPGDNFTWADTVVEAKLQYWIQRFFPGFYLPASAGPTWSDP